MRSKAKTDIEKAKIINENKANEEPKKEIRDKKRKYRKKIMKI